ncbi:cadherin related 23 [Phyllostomus discolor]|uniref:Cadherin related 23 n=1 Tax=Phyllostomus discolor TaxID=89673 RepID=A0A834ABA8_9CHIR|nr:cadherin related 23 [Phyllostomus discolor]
MQVGMPRMDFLINSSSGVVVTTTELDRERIPEYQLRVVATDAGTPTKSSTSTLTIRVLDVNDETPTFFPTVYNVSVSEDVPRDFRVVWLNCTDNDVGLNAELSYFITSAALPPALLCRLPGVGPASGERPTLATRAQPLLEPP